MDELPEDIEDLAGVVLEGLPLLATDVLFAGVVLVLPLPGALVAAAPVAGFVLAIINS